MDIRSMLQFGPKITFKPAEDAPSIYADSTEWEAYRAKQALEASLQAEQTLADQGVSTSGQMANQLVGELASDPSAMDRELRSLINRYPANTVLSPQKSIKPDDNPVLPTGQTRQNAKQDLINKNWNDKGIQAFTDAKGQLVLTNNMSATDATSAMKPFTPVGSVQQTGTAGSLLTSIRGAADLAEAQGIYYTLQTAVTEQAAKFKTDALRFAEQKVGLPAMRQELQNAITADRNDIAYKPGMGDSPITAKIRQQITGLEDQAQQEADRWLSRNVSYAQLNNTLTAAKSEVDRFTRKQDWKDQREFSANLQADARKQTLIDKQEAQAASVPVETRSRILRLHPELQNEENPGMAIFNQTQQMLKKGGKAVEQALIAPDNALPGMAVRGNQTATELVISKEAELTGESPDLIRGRLENAKRLSSDPKFLQQAYSAVFRSAKDKATKVKDSIAEFNKLSNGNAEEKEKAAQIRAELALDYVRTTATERFVSDLSKLQTTNTKLGDAVRLAMKQTGSANLENVTAAWVGDATGPEAVAAYQALIATLQAEGLKYKDSIFGVPNMPAINAAITQMADNKLTVMGRVKSAIGMMGADTFMPSPMQGALLAKPFTLNQGE